MVRTLFVIMLGLLILPGCGFRTEKKISDAEKKIEYLESRLDSYEVRISQIEEKEKLMEGFYSTKAKNAETVSAEMMRNEDVQRALQKAGYYKGKIDGKIGPVSTKAIKEFEKDNGLKVDGLLDEETKRLLINKLNQ